MIVQSNTKSSLRQHTSKSSTTPNTGCKHLMLYKSRYCSSHVTVQVTLPYKSSYCTSHVTVQVNSLYRSSYSTSQVTSQVTVLSNLLYKSNYCTSQVTVQVKSLYKSSYSTRKPGCTRESNCTSESKCTYKWLFTQSSYTRIEAVHVTGLINPSIKPLYPSTGVRTS